MTDPHRIDGLPRASLPAMIAICALSGYAGEVGQLSPVFFGAMAEARGYGPAELGRIISVGGVGGLLTALTSPLWLPRAHLRVTAVGLVTLSLAAIALQFVAQTALQSMLVQVLYGVGTGALYTLMFGAVSLYAQPERTLGWKLGLESLPGMAMLFLVSNFAIQHGGFNSVLIAIAASTLVLGASAFLLPNAKPRPAAAVVPVGAPGSSLALWLAAGSAFVLWGGEMALFPFMERIGAAQGLSVATIGTALTIGWIFATLGGLAAGGLGDRIGIGKPFLVGIALCLLGLFMFQRASALSFEIAANIFLAGIVFAVVYTIALITNLNTHPLLTGLGSAVLQAAGALGPAVGGALYQKGGAASVFLLCGACCVISAALFLAALFASRTRRRIPIAVSA